MTDQNMASLPRIERTALPRAAGAASRLQLWRRRNPAFVRGALSALAALSDAAAIVFAALASGAIYHRAAYEMRVEFEDYLRLGVVMALLFVVPNILRRDYTVSRYLSFEGHIGRTFTLWNVAFMSALIVAFLTKTSSDFSRGTAIVFYGGGFGLIVICRFMFVRIVHDQARVGGVAARRIFLVGYEDEIERFTREYNPGDLGLRVVSAAVLRGSDTLHEDLALAAATARVLRPEDVFILAPWSQKETIEACVNAFLRVPASIHLGTERVLAQFTDFEVERMGPIASLHLVRRPLSTFEIIQKRIFDVIVSTIALVLLSPLFALMALLIKLDSRGPVFFMQRRYGFNQEPFRIYKFRSMTTLDDGPVVVQAKENDVRITRIGAFIRKWNIDELPQLINVLRGEMSLVGPRPHALAHDQQYERTIALYARRHNVKPGITGWAQVSGLRGETSSDEKMRKRVEHDLYYIDHWSLLFDIRIMFLTVFSGKAYRNAR